MSLIGFSDDWFRNNIPQFQRFLGDLKDRPCRLLEIGSYEGRATVWMAENVATHRSSSIDTIDIDDNPRRWRNLAAYVGKTRFHHGASLNVLRELPLAESYDFVYVDGCHSTVNVMEDAVHAFPLLKVGGIMAFDDYLGDPQLINQGGRPKEAIDAFLAVYADRIELLHREYQVWLRKKTPRGTVAAMRASAHVPTFEEQRLRNELAAIRNSRSWRLTAPLRWVVGKIRRG